jgi:ADP-ribosyl-[dinitrogen reductase] hydrolase
VCGQIAGAFYGARTIPATWLAKLTMRLDIEKLASELNDVLSN